MNNQLLKALCCGICIFFESGASSTSLLDRIRGISQDDDFMPLDDLGDSRVVDSTSNHNIVTRILKTIACPVITCEGHRDCVVSAVFNGAEDKIVTSSLDGSVKLWEAKSGNCLSDFPKHKGAVYSAAFNKREDLILTASTDGAVSLLDATTGKSVKIFQGNKCKRCSAQFNKAEDKILATSDTTIKLLDAETGASYNTFIGHKAVIYSAVFHDQEDTLLTASEDKTLKLWDVKTGLCKRTIPGHSGIKSAVFNRAGTKILFCQKKEVWVRLWDTDRSDTRCTNFWNDDYHHLSAAFNPSEDIMLTASYWDSDGMREELYAIILWKVSPYKNLRIFPVLPVQEFIWSTRFNKAGDKILVASGLTAKIIDVRKFNEIFILLDRGLSDEQKVLLDKISKILDQHAKDSTIRLDLDRHSSLEKAYEQLPLEVREALTPYVTTSSSQSGSTSTTSPCAIV
jgi:WD40 repeat protein